VITIDGRNLTLADVEAVARDRARVRLHGAAAERIRASRTLLEDLIENETPVYGVNTGFGRLADTRIPRSEQRALQRNLVRSHAAGVGMPLPAEEVRAIMVLRANTLARGQSGCRPAVVERVLRRLKAALKTPSRAGIAVSVATRKGRGRGGQTHLPSKP